MGYSLGTRFAIEREMLRSPLLQVTLPYMAEDEVIEEALT